MVILQLNGMILQGSVAQWGFNHHGDLTYIFSQLGILGCWEQPWLAKAHGSRIKHCDEFTVVI